MRSNLFWLPTTAVWCAMTQALSSHTQVILLCASSVLVSQHIPPERPLKK